MSKKIKEIDLASSRGTGDLKTLKRTYEGIIEKNPSLSPMLIYSPDGKRQTMPNWSSIPSRLPLKDHLNYFAVQFLTHNKKKGILDQSKTLEERTTEYLSMKPAPWSPDPNAIGILLGPGRSGAVVLDVDTKHMFEHKDEHFEESGRGIDEVMEDRLNHNQQLLDQLPEWVWEKCLIELSGSGGMHIIFIKEWKADSISQKFINTTCYKGEVNNIIEYFGEESLNASKYVATYPSSNYTLLSSKSLADLSEKVSEPEFRELETIFRGFYEKDLPQNQQPNTRTTTPEFNTQEPERFVDKDGMQWNIDYKKAAEILCEKLEGDGYKINLNNTEKDKGTSLEGTVFFDDDRYGLHCQALRPGGSGSYSVVINAVSGTVVLHSTSLHGQFFEDKQAGFGNSLRILRLKYGMTNYRLSESDVIDVPEDRKDSLKTVFEHIDDEIKEVEEDIMKLRATTAPDPKTLIEAIELNVAEEREEINQSIERDITLRMNDENFLFDDEIKDIRKDTSISDDDKQKLITSVEDKRKKKLSSIRAEVRRNWNNELTKIEKDRLRQVQAVKAMVGGSDTEKLDKIKSLDAYLRKLEKYAALPEVFTWKVKSRSGETEVKYKREWVTGITHDEMIEFCVINFPAPEHVTLSPECYSIHQASINIEFVPRISLVKDKTIEHPWTMESKGYPIVEIIKKTAGYDSRAFEAIGQCYFDCRFDEVREEHQTRLRNSGLDHESIEDYSGFAHSLFRYGLSVKPEIYKTVMKKKELRSSPTLFVPFNPIADTFARITEKNGGLPAIEEALQYNEHRKLVDYMEFEHEHEREYLAKHLLKHHVRGINQMLNQKTNREMIGYIGPQDIGKSMISNWLWGEFGEDLIYADTNIDGINNSDTARLLSINVLCLVEEISSMKPHELNKFKSLISAMDKKDRAAYEEKVRKFKRRASFEFNSNNTKFLQDVQNKRFIPVTLTDLDWQGYLKNVDRSKLWLDAYTIHQANPDYGRLTKDERFEQEENNRKYLNLKPIEEYLSTFLQNEPEPENITSGAFKESVPVLLQFSEASLLTDAMFKCKVSNYEFNTWCERNKFTAIERITKRIPGLRYKRNMYLFWVPSFSLTEGEMEKANPYGGQEYDNEAPKHKFVYYDLLKKGNEHLYDLMIERASQTRAYLRCEKVETE